MQSCSVAGEPTVCECAAVVDLDASTPTPDASGADAGDPDASDAASSLGGSLDGGFALGDAALAEVIAEPNDDATYLFDQTQVRTYNIVIAASDLATINADPGAEAWVPASLEFEGATYGPYQVRYKGSLGSFRYPCTNDEEHGPKVGKCSLKVGFDRLDPEARFYGLRKLNFNATNNDASMMRDRLGYSLFRDHGVAAPRAVHARVLINGVFEGLYIAAEQVDGRFTRARFAEGGEGNVYKEAWPTAGNARYFLDALETNRDEQPVVQGMLDFASAIREGPTSAERFTDRKYMMRLFAVDRVIINDDGIVRFNCDPVSQSPGTNHNYYWYQAAESTRFWLVPWDLDNAFDNTPWVHVETPWYQTVPCSCVNSPEYGAQVPPSCDPLIGGFAAWRTDYELEVDAFLAGAFAKARVDAKLDTWATQIQEYVAQAAGVNLAPTETVWAEGLRSLKTKIDSARAYRGYAY